MSARLDFAQTFAEHHLPALFAHVWNSTIFLALALLAVAALRRRLTAGARLMIVGSGIAKFAIPSSLLTGGFESLRSMFPPTSAPLPLELPLQVLAGPFNLTAPAPRPAAWLLVAVIASLAVTLALVARFSLVRRRLVAIAARTATPPLQREVEALDRARRRIGMRRSVDIARTPVPEAPAVLRILRPLIILPICGCDELSDSELESLLTHECAHVVRHDNLFARLEHLVGAFFWFHPLIWFALRIAAAERERACDEAVAASADQRDTYLSALAKFCAASIAPRLPGVSCMTTSRLKERIDHVMNYPELRTHAMSPRRVGVAAIVSLIAFTVASALLGGATLSAESSSNTAAPPSSAASAERLEANVVAGPAQGTYACFVTLLQLPSHTKTFAEVLDARIGETSEKVWGEQDSEGNGHEFRLSCTIDASGSEAVVGLRRTRFEAGSPASFKTFESRVAPMSGARVSGELRSDEANRFAVKLTAARSGGTVTIKGAVSESGSSVTISEPTIVTTLGQGATSRSTAGDREIEFDVAPWKDGSFIVKVTIIRGDTILQVSRFVITPSDSPEKPRFTGEPIDMSLKDADLRDVIKTFGQLTMLDMRIESEIERKVTVEWHNVPWDQAFDELMKEHGLTYRVEGSVIRISKK